MGAIKIKHQLALFIAAFVLAFVIFGALAFNTLNALKVNGPYYRKVVLGKDLVSDILPPPEYVLEANLVAHQMADPANRPFLQGLAAKSEDLRKDFDNRHTYWVGNLSASTPNEKRLKQALVVESYQPALRFLNTLRDSFLPAVQRQDYPAAAQLLHGSMQQDYEAHRAAINQVVTLTNTSNQIIEADVERISAARLVTLALLGIAIVAGTAWGIRRFLQHAIAEELAARTKSDAALNGASHAQVGSAPDAPRPGNDLPGQTSVMTLDAALKAARSSQSALSLLEGQEQGSQLVSAELRSLASENAKLMQQISRLVEHLQNAGSATP